MENEFKVVPLPTRVRPRAPRKKRPSTPAAVTVTFLCPNCEARFRPPNLRRVYCSLRCESEASYVRRHRRVLVRFPDGDIPEDIAYALRIQRAHTLSGGYDDQAHRLPNEIRSAVMERENGLCCQCGEPGEEIDHIDGPSSDLSNLQYLCRGCHHAKTDTNLKPITDDEVEARRDDLFLRVYGDEVLHPSDAEDWPEVWRSWRKQHTLPD